MQLGCFSVSLAVKDIAKSRAFYEQLGFAVIHGDQSQNWLIMGNETTKIGLFQGMFEHNILTFNPGWSPTAEALESFDDVRDIQRQLKANGTAFESEADESSTGPANFVIRDPDGNLIMLDQHVSKGT
jgi:lactoylglutathione lyase